MAKPVSKRFASQIDPGAQRRGRGYFRQGRVELKEVEPDWVLAEVRGSRRRIYYVEMGLVRHRLMVACDCPFFAERGPCKHVWATLLALDEARFTLPRRVKQLETAFNRDQFLAADSLFRRGPKRLPGGPDTWHRAAQGIPNWQEKLDDAVRFRIRRAAHWARSLAGTQELRFVLDPARALREEALVLRTFVISAPGREPVALGELPADAHRRFTPRDCDLLELLELPVGSRFGHRASMSRIVVSDERAAHVLSRLAAVERLFLWDPETAGPVAEPLGFDHGPPYRLALKVETLADDAGFHVQGELVRGDDRISLEDALAVIAPGLIIFPDCVATLEAGDAFGWVQSLQGSSPLHVPMDGEASLRRALMETADAAEIDAPESLAPSQTGVPRGRLLISEPAKSSDYAIPDPEANLRYLYEDVEVVPGDPTRTLEVGGEIVLRDLAGEAELAANLAQRGASLLHYDSTRTTLQLPRKDLATLLSDLAEEGWVIDVAGRRVRPAGATWIGVKTDVDWFEVDGSVDYGGERVSLPELLRAASTGGRFVRLSDGSQGILPADLSSFLNRLSALGKHSGDQLQFSRAQSSLLDALLDARDDVDVDAQFEEVRQRIRGLRGVAAARQPRGFRGKLRPYQRVGLGWLRFLADLGLGGCLADEMGLGKTIQVLALLEGRRASRAQKKKEDRGPLVPSLIVAPKSLIFNWAEEAARFAPKLKILRFVGRNRHEAWEAAPDTEILLTTYGTLRRDIPMLAKRRFEFAILDEAQAIKTVTSQTAKAARLIQADHRLALTGTPVENHLGELWSLFEFLNPGMLGRSSRFRATLRDARQGRDRDAIDSIGKAVRPFLLRRTKQEVLDDLPTKTEQTLSCPLSGKQRKLYDELRRYYRESLLGRVDNGGLGKAKMHVLEALLRLRQAASHPGLVDQRHRQAPSAKLELLLEHVPDLVEEGHKCLIFSQFVTFLGFVREELDAHGIEYAYLDGQSRDRQGAVERFQNDPNCHVFLISLKAGGHGLNLTAADYVFLLDPWWNPAVEAQAIDRTHRIGQQRPVFAYRLIAEDTVEEKILKLQAEKRALADSIGTGDESLLRSLTADDLEMLLD